MTTFQAIREFLETNYDELVYDLSEDERTRFENALHNLQRDWPTLPDDEVRSKITLDEMQKYPAVWQHLGEARLVPYTSLPATVADAAPHTSSRDNARMDDDQTLHIPRRASAQPRDLAKKKHEYAAGNTVPPSQSVVDRITLRKELITGIVGIAIVAVTLFLVVATVFTVSNAETHSAVKDALLFMNGLVGVVLGYYFGRIPADARADQAESQARTAQQERDDTLATVRTVLETSASRGSQRGPGAGEVTLTPEQVESLQRVLHRYGA